MLRSILRTTRLRTTPPFLAAGAALLMLTGMVLTTGCAVGPSAYNTGPSTLASPSDLPAGSGTTASSTGDRQPLPGARTSGASPTDCESPPREPRPRPPADTGGSGG